MGVAWAAIFRTDVTVFVVGADAIAAACSAVGNTTVAIFIVPANTISTFFFTWFFFAFLSIRGSGVGTGHATTGSTGHGPTTATRTKTVQDPREHS